MFSRVQNIEPPQMGDVTLRPRSLIVLFQPRHMLEIVI